MNVYGDGYASGHRGESWGMANQAIGSGLYSEFDGRESRAGGGMYEGMALPDHFLGQYYSQVSNYFYMWTLTFCSPW